MAFRWSTTKSTVPQAIEKKRGAKCPLEPLKLLAQLVCEQNGQFPGGQTFGGDELRHTRETIAKKYTACQLLYWYRSNELWKNRLGIL
jgi:hypothetical protein